MWLLFLDVGLATQEKILNAARCFVSIERRRCVNIWNMGRNDVAGQVFRRTQLVWFLAVAVFGCVRFPKDYTAQQLQRDATHLPKEALAHYLMQPAADPAVCDTTATRSRLLTVTEESFEAVAEVFATRQNRFDIPAQCLRHLYETASIPLSQAGTLLVFDATAEVLERREAEVGDVERLQAIADVTLSRAPASNLPARPLGDMAKQLERALSALSTTDVRRPIGQALLDSLDVERGKWKNQVIDSNFVAANKETSTLWLLAHRSSNAQYARLAQAQLVRVRMANSSFPVIRNGGEALVERVLALGRNPVDSRFFPLSTALWKKPVGFGVQFRQDTKAQKLIVRREENRLQLADVLELSVQGYERPVPLCSPKERFNPEPCVELASLSVGNPLTSLDADGMIRLKETLSFDELASTLHEKVMAVPVFWETAALGAVELPMHFVTPAPVRYQGFDNQPGLTVNARVTALGSRTLFEVEARNTPHKAIVENDALASFHIETVGADGWAGNSGHDGANGKKGSDGHDASCPSSEATSGSNGGNGGDGGNGAHGGPGQNGGNVLVSLNCQASDCAALQQAVSGVFVSKGGQGGSGGRAGDGGKGGKGGKGGSGAQCGKDGSLSSASDGADGSSGSDGFRGSDGPNGAPGNISFTVLPRAGSDVSVRR